MSANYEKKQMLDGIASVTFKDLMEFSDMLSDDLIDNGKEMIESYVLARSLSSIANFIIEDENQIEAEKKKNQPAKN